MKKIALILLGIILISSTAFAARGGKKTESALTAAKSSTIAVASQATIYTLAFSVSDVEYEKAVGVMYKCSGTTCDSSLFAEQSYERPDTEGSLDVNWIGTHLIDASIADTNWKMATLETVSMPFMRFKIIGGASNSADVTFSIKVAK